MAGSAWADIPTWASKTCLPPLTVASQPLSWRRSPSVTASAESTIIHTAWRIRAVGHVTSCDGDPEAMVGEKVMPTLPLSVMNVMDGMRGTQDMVVLGESSVNEASSQALDYVVSGAQVLTITVK